MRTIYKYRLEITEKQGVSMPFDSEILCVQNQGGNATLWAAVDPHTGGNRTRTILMCGMGHPMPNRGHYIGTVQIARLVWHFFDGAFEVNPDE